MIKVDLWETDGMLDEALTRGAMAVEKFWHEDTAKACVELLAFNFDRGYRCHVYTCFAKPEQTENAVDKTLGLLVGNPKWIGLLLYAKDERGPFDEPWESYNEQRLRYKVRRNEEKITALALKLIQERGKPTIKKDKDVIVEYDLDIKYVVQRSGDQHVFWVLGSSLFTDSIIQNVPEDTAEFGGLVEYYVPEVEDVDLVDIVEEEDAITIRVDTKDSRERGRDLGHSEH